MVISVSLGEQSYPILLEAGALARAGQHLSLSPSVSNLLSCSRTPSS